MADPILMPQMGYDVTQAKVVRWLKNVGDSVKKGESVAEIETDKVTIEIEAFHEGVLTEILVEPGRLVPVGTPIAMLGSATDQASTPSQKHESTSAAPKPPPAAAVGAFPTAVNMKESVSPVPGAPSLPPGAVPSRRTDGNGHRYPVSPVARKLAEASGVDAETIHGTGPGGRVTREDVEQILKDRAIHAIEQRVHSTVSEVEEEPPSTSNTASSLAPRPTVARRPTTSRAGENRPLTPLRQTIARRMATSTRNAPHFYVTIETDVTDALKFRSLINQGRAEADRITVNDLIVSATARALPKFPDLNASFADDHIVVYGQIDVGIAVALEAGLITVVLHDADQKSLVELSRETNNLVARARAGRLRPEEFGAGTFTISNLGTYGIESFTAIINPPQSAILAVGSALRRPVWIDNGFVPRDVMKLTLSVDHRVADGAMAARFLNEVKRLLEKPGLLL